MKPVRRTLLALAAALALPVAAVAQDFPNKTIRMVVPFGPGTTTDIVGRVMAESTSIMASWLPMRASRVAKRGSSKMSGRSMARARPSQNLGGEDMCSATQWPSWHSST